MTPSLTLVEELHKMLVGNDMDEVVCVLSCALVVALKEDPESVEHMHPALYEMLARGVVQ